MESVNRTAQLRLSAVKFKNGGSVRVMPGLIKSETRAKAEGSIRRCLDNIPAVVGYAFVAWDAEGGSVAAYCSSAPFPASLMPEFVKGRLATQLAVDWAAEDKD